MGTHIYDKYRPDHDFGGKRVLNIGCGFAQFKRPNVVNVDAYDICKPDALHDRIRYLRYDIFDVCWSQSFG